MQQRVKYRPFMAEKYSQMRETHPEMLRDVDDRERFYLDMIYTLMTRNKALEERIKHITEHSHTLEQQVRVRQQNKPSAPVKEDKREEERSEKDSKSRTMIPQHQPIEEVQKDQLKPIKHQKPSQPKPQPTKRSQPPRVQFDLEPLEEAKNMDTRRNMYLQDKKTAKPGDNPEILQLSSPTKPSAITPSDKFKQQIISTLKEKPVGFVPKKTSIPEDRHSIASNSSSTSTSERRLSCQKYLTSPGPSQPSTLQSSQAPIPIEASYAAKRKL